MNSTNNLVHKSKELNQLRTKDFDYYTYRIFCAAISKLNPYAEEKDRVSVVRFSLKEYQEIMGLKYAVKGTWLDDYANNVNSKTGEEMKKQAKAITKIGVIIPNDKKGFIALNVIRKFEVKEEDGERIIELTFESELLDQIYGISKNFISYRLYNVLNMKSYQQQRLYELIKQYQYQKKKIINLEELKVLLGIKKDAYPVWGDFSQKILKKAQKEFEKGADVTFTFKPIRKGKKTESVEFYIHKNENYVDKYQKQNDKSPIMVATPSESEQDLPLNFSEKVKVMLTDGREAWVPMEAIMYNNCYDFETGDAIYKVEEYGQYAEELPGQINMDEISEQLSPADEKVDTINIIKEQRFDAINELLPLEAKGFLFNICDLLTSKITSINPMLTINPAEMTEVMMQIVGKFNREIWNPASIIPGTFKHDSVTARGRWYNNAFENQLSQGNYDWLIKGEKPEPIKEKDTSFDIQTAERKAKENRKDFGSKKNTPRHNKS